MVKLIVIYDSWFGNTKRLAETIGDAIKETEKVTVAVKEIKKVELNEIADFDVILIGSPNHMGGPTRGVKKFIDNLGKTGVKGKKVAVFDTYVKKNIGKAVRKMEQRINEKALGMKLIKSGLSIKLRGIKGPIMEGELVKAVNFATEISKQITA